ncbi:MAG TPA: hypothetical protein VFO55_13210, partial [Gemmatimonadaceae bacterium]|nr:hypothetical protein [Gemmatimonadaceae bacterium]
FGSGTDLGTSEFVVYAGTGNSVTVTGLSAATTYHVAIYEFNGGGGSENYFLTGPLTGNQTTSALDLIEAGQATLIQETQVTTPTDVAAGDPEVTSSQHLVENVVVQSDSAALTRPTAIRESRQQVGTIV